MLLQSVFYGLKQYLLKWYSLQSAYKQYNSIRIYDYTTDYSILKLNTWHKTVYNDKWAVTCMNVTSSRLSVKTSCCGTILSILFFSCVNCIWTFCICLWHTDMHTQHHYIYHFYYWLVPSTPRRSRRGGGGGGRRKKEEEKMKKKKKKIETTAAKYNGLLYRWPK